MDSDHVTDQIVKNVQSIVSAIKQRLKDRTRPLVVSLDGGSGAGKSTLAFSVASLVGATVVHCDDFFAIQIPENEWDTYSPEQKCRLCIDWGRVRSEVLQPLLMGKKAEYQPYYCSTMNGVSNQVVTLEPSRVIILDGIYSSLLSDVVDLTVLVDVSSDVRHERHNLRERTDDLAWHKRWDCAEDYYFSVLRLSSSFDVIVVNE